MPTTLASEENGAAQAQALTDAQWAQYEQDGYLRLGKVLSDEGLAALQQRIDDIMRGTADIPYEKILMQLDSTTGKYNDAGKQSKGHKGATLAYRKIQDLEYDPLFLAYTEHPLRTPDGTPLYYNLFAVCNA